VSFRPAVELLRNDHPSLAAAAPIRAAAWLEKYIRESRLHLVVEPDDDTVFLSNAGEPFSQHHLSDLVCAPIYLWNSSAFA